MQCVQLMYDAMIEAKPECHEVKVGKDRDFRLKTKEVGPDEPLPDGINAFYNSERYEQTTDGKH